MAMLFFHRLRPPAPLIAVMLALAVVVAACGGGTDGPTSESAGGDRDRSATGDLALVDPTDAEPTESGDRARTPVTARGRRVTTVPPPVELGVEQGTTDNPFVPLPPVDEARAVQTASGVVVPVIDERPSSWLVSTPCQGVGFVTDAKPIGRAHVVLDPGHGGVEFGAVGATGLTEKDLNLRVARLTAEILERAGATVVLARTGDYTITAAARGQIARAIDPALLVSIHHNGGAPAGGDRPGTIVYTKAGSPASTRFGGLLYQTLQPMLQGAGEWKRQAYRTYIDALEGHESAVTAYDRALAARDAILVANGQIPAGATTVPPTTIPQPPGRPRTPSVRQPITTTTVPATTAADGQPPLPVPDPPVPPPPFEPEPVREFSWAGTGNAGVRSWSRSDGQDYLAVLRHSGDVPAVLAEFPYLSNPAEEELLSDPAFVEREAGVLADAIILYFTTTARGTGHVGDQYDDQPIGGSGGIDSCVEPEL